VTKTWLAAAVLLLGCAAPSARAQEKVAFTVLKGWYEGRVEEPTVLVLKDEDAYVKQFHETFARHRFPRPVPEKVDFASHQVVAVLWSAMPSTGYAIAVSSVTGTPKETTVTVKTTVPKGITDPEVTYPAVALVILKTDSVRVLVTGDRNPPGRWWKDFADQKKGLEVLVK